MSAWVVISLIVVVLLLLAVGGAVAQRRRLDESRERFELHLEQTNLDLAAAHAEDKGWDARGLEQAARDALAEQRPEARDGDLTLVQVVDRPGTEDDRAVFRVDVAGGVPLTLTLARHDGRWLSHGVEG